MTGDEVLGVLLSEIGRYEGFSTDLVKVGDYTAIRISRGSCIFDMVVHPMLEAQYISYVRLVLDCVAMYAAKLEVIRAV